MKFLEIELIRKPKTDSEYVERIRKIVSHSKWFGVLQFCLAAVFFGLYAFIWKMVFWPVQGNAELPEGVGLGFGVGIIFGAFAGMMLVFAANSIILGVQCLKELRTERLMLKFHDELQALRENSQQKVP